MNLTHRPVTPKGQKRIRIKRSESPWAIIGTDDEFLQFLREQPSCINAQFGCDPCHYRTAKNSGIGCKPPYSAIPMTRAQHEEQHRVGQFNFRPKGWWEKMVRKYLILWAESKGMHKELAEILKQVLGEL